MGSSQGQQTIQGACVSEIAVHDHGRRLNQREFRMKSDPRLNWSFDSSIRYSGLSRHLLSSSRRLSRSYRRELLLFVSSPSSSSRQLPRSTRREFLLLDSFVSSTSETASLCITSPSTRQVSSSSRRPLRSTRRELT